ncbi:DUF397 domain-containing protein [Actinosynnema sp. ALI-1.44]|uniref:DUF397 domain-containing protein n=1 Tax=Actinosynnema sp. ALI-1.44 TaxID=1933779 RepID=UPI00097C084B|nr:DUF397 domain-containing protein [Actinosynnema sp. ALI-1.44]ONI77257.1 DUF397 domain-containing protein [Actinosynnema sp. ALI-1.44]
MRDTGWFKSSYSGAGTDNCVEVRISDYTASVRDTKNRTAGTLDLPATAWRQFLRAMPSVD